VVETLTQIWERLLRRRSIGPDEDFFDLGGDPWTAVALFEDIQKATGRMLSPLVIYQAPTIAALAGFLEASQVVPISRCILLKSGNFEPPIFMIHGLAGNIMEFFNLVKHFSIAQAVYGLQARGIDGLEAPCVSIEQMADYHVASITKLQPQGPYILVGYSLGGLVAMETARLLMAAGQEIALLVMIDSYPLVRYAPFSQRLRVYMRKVIEGGRKIMKRSSSSELGLRDRNLGIAFTPEMQKVEDAARKAQRDYEPRRFPGKIRFVRAAKPLNFPDDPEKVWSKFVSGMESETVPGDHHELLTTYHEHLAETISHYMHSLSGKRQTGSSYG
jgi:thioesterase domain-containing protein